MACSIERTSILVSLRALLNCAPPTHDAAAGERVCVDLAQMLHPGEGLLVGSFAKGLFLVHSECQASLHTRKVCTALEMHTA